MTLSIEAFHGTSLQAAKEIEAISYNESNKENEWLGKGIYFFVDGISDPLVNATEWAIAQAWDNDNKKNNYHDYAVLKSVVAIEESRMIDLTNQEGLRNFNGIKTKLLNKIFKEFSSAQLKDLDESYHSCAMFNYIVKTINTHAIKHNLYIKNKKERRMNLKLNVPNTTVLCVRKENFKSDAKMIHQGVIS